LGEKEVIVARELSATETWPHPRLVAVGFFDGVHRGHQYLLGRLVDRARAEQGTSTVLTFDPHPLSLVDPALAPPLLTPLPRKAALMGELGVERLVVLRFDERLRELTPEQFVRQVLVTGLAPAAVLVGFNFTFGYRGEGTPKLLQRLGQAHGLPVEVVPPVFEEGVVVSSTEVRRCLAAGDVEAARRLLGRPYRLGGWVVRGEGRGRLLGFPTCNLDVPPGVVIPGPGVYAVRVQLPAGGWARGVCNIGVRPTFGAGRLLVETHVLDAGGDWYGEPLELDFWVRLRAEQTFASAAELAAQLAQDAGRARRLLPPP
jgi:riboflavin kinase/FMN adenylyltransferase